MTRPAQRRLTLERGPIGLGVPDIDVDDALERLAHRWSFRSAYML
jgi:hypothetical protein